MKTRILIPITVVGILAALVLFGMNFVSAPVPPPRNFDEDTITLERTACFGSCPVYSVTVFSNGMVIFEGVQHVENIGIFEYEIPRENAEKIFEKFHEINFFALGDKYTVNSTDLPTAITTFRNESYEKTVSNYGNGGPDNLESLEIAIDRFANTEQMIKKKLPEPRTASAYEMKPNSMEFFYYPNPEDTQNRDVFQKFILIRLPEWLGGNAQDVSAFRAYSAVSLSDHCLVKYWPEESRQRMENPCRGDIYRAIDGLLISGIDPIMITSPMALPYLDLEIDENGSLYVKTPSWTPEQNGVISFGRHMAMQDIREGSQIISDSFAESNPDFPIIPVDFAGKTLTEINSQNHGITARYLDFSSMYGNTSIDIDRVSSQEAEYRINLAKSDSEFWQIDNHVITTNKQGAYFVKDGFEFQITGENHNYIRKEILRNFFPEHNADEMFLISKTTE